LWELWAAIAMIRVFGVLRANAVLTMSMLAFFIYLALLLWAFSDRRLGRLYAIFFGGGTLLLIAAYGLNRLSGVS
jgi:hypothetical protein